MMLITYVLLGFVVVIALLGGLLLWGLYLIAEEDRENPHGQP